jgi:hypothetical protein
MISGKIKKSLSKLEICQALKLMSASPKLAMATDSTSACSDGLTFMTATEGSGNIVGVDTAVGVRSLKGR